MDWLQYYSFVEVDPNDVTRQTWRRATEADRETILNYIVEGYAKIFGLNSITIQGALADFSAIMSEDDTTAPDDPRQRAHDRSKRDRRRKSRAGRYRWGGRDDEG